MTLFFIKRKSNIAIVFKEYLDSYKSRNQPLLTIRLDNSGEFIGEEFILILKEEGIFREPGVPYSPKLNSVTKRINHIINSKVRAIRALNKLPKFL